MATTVRDIVNRALRLIGVAQAGEDVGGNEGKDALSALNMMIGQWDNEKLFVSSWLNENFTLTAGDGTYYIGPDTQVITDNAGTFTAGYVTITVNGTGITQTFSTDKNTTLTALATAIANTRSDVVKTAAYSAAAHTITLVPTGKKKLTIEKNTTNVTGTMTMTVAAQNPTTVFDTERPVRIERAFFRQTADVGTYNYDYPIEIIPNNKYQEIFLKSLSVTYPLYLYYNPTYPLGEISLWPYPTNGGILGISQWASIGPFANMSEEIELPPGYETALAYNLAVELMPEYGKNDQLVMLKAAETKMSIMRTNTEQTLIKTDSALMPQKAWNIYTASYGR